MICTQCGTKLHDEAQRCWKCGAETPNNTVELAPRYQAGSVAQLWRNPERISRSGRKLIRVYKESLIGRRLAGWIDEFGRAYRNNRPNKPIMLPDFSVDDQGRIYIEFDGNRALIGWIAENGVEGGDSAVYAQYGDPASGFYSYPQNTSLFQPPVEFSPALAFYLKPDGTVYRRVRGGVKIIAEVEGASNINQIAGLALALLL